MTVYQKTKKTDWLRKANEARSKKEVERQVGKDLSLTQRERRQLNRELLAVFTKS